MKKYNGWQNFATIQFKEIISELVDAKEESKAIMLIAGTGLGKTNAIKKFKEKNPKHTYVITLGQSYSLITLLNEIQRALGIKEYHGKNSRHIILRDIISKLVEIGQQGGHPIIALDEAENASVNVLKAIKQLYDGVIEYCSIVLIGTDQLIAALNKKSSGQSIPQLNRRFKAGTRFVTEFNKAKDMKPFFDQHIPHDHNLQDLLIELCDNYGELHDYLDPFLKHCDKKNLAANEANFRMYHKLLKRK